MGSKSSKELDPVAEGKMEQSIRDAVANNEVVIYSKSYCPHCIKTKNLFNFNFPSTNVKVYELDKIAGGKGIQATLLKMTGQRTVPNVWVGGNHVGGSDDTQAASSSGSLARQISILQK